VVGGRLDLSFSYENILAHWSTVERSGIHLKF